MRSRLPSLVYFAMTEHHCLEKYEGRISWRGRKSRKGRRNREVGEVGGVEGVEELGGVRWVGGRNKPVFYCHKLPH